MSGFSVSTAEKDPAKFAIAIQQLFSGRSNAVGVVTLTPNATSTTVAAGAGLATSGVSNCGPGSKVLLFQATANAGAALATTFIPLATISRQQFIIQHANNAQTDRTFVYVIVG